MQSIKSRMLTTQSIESPHRLVGPILTRGPLVVLSFIHHTCGTCSYNIYQEWQMSNFSPLDRCIVSPQTIFKKKRRLLLKNSFPNWPPLSFLLSSASNAVDCMLRYTDECHIIILGFWCQNIQLRRTVKGFGTLEKTLHVLLRSETLITHFKLPCQNVATHCNSLDLELIPQDKSGHCPRQRFQVSLDHRSAEPGNSRRRSPPVH